MAVVTHHDRYDRAQSTPVKRWLFGTLPGEKEVHCFTLGDPTGPSVTVSEYGCTLTSVRMPDRSGNAGEIILGYPQLAQYIGDTDYLGATIGRYANRIAGATCKIGKERIRLSANEGANHLHGGFTGFNKRFWKGEVVGKSNAPSVRLELMSLDGEEGYPGTLRCSATFTFRAERELEVVYEARTDRPTIVNLTLHPYFNLGGPGGEISGHRLSIAAEAYLPICADGLPTGAVEPVEGTPFDFRHPVALGERLEEDAEQLSRANGYDHCWVLGEAYGTMKPAARVSEPVSGRMLEVRTTAPGIQFYSGNQLGEGERAEGSAGFAARSGFSLEPQSWPDSPNRRKFPRAILNPGDVYIHRIQYVFGIERESNPESAG